MINDILFCLLGYTGGVFLDNKDSNEFTINETIDCITNSEKELLKKIAEIGYKYKILKDFVKNYEDLFNQKLMRGNSIFKVITTNINLEENNNNNNIPSEENNLNNENLFENEINTSVYLSSICQSLSDFLKNYEHEISKLESKFYQDLNLTGSEIISQTERYSNIFDRIYEFLQYITSKNIKGGELLNFLHEATITGDLHVKNVFKSFFINSNKIILNFITFWIINGSITSDEFFITSANNFVLKLNEEPNSYSNFHSDIMNNNSNKSELESWSANYYIEYSNIPNYFPHSLVEDILFVGKAIKILNSNKNLEEDKIPFNEISIFYNTLQKLNDLSFNNKNNNNDTNHSQEEVNMINIELISKIITLIKSCTAKYLWKLVVYKKGFLDHLNAVKNMFLTFNGEFFYCFINKIKKLLNLPFDKKIEYEINEVYFKSALKETFTNNTNNEKLYSNFRVKLISSGFNYNFGNSNVKNYVEKKEISFIGSINFDSYSNSLRFINTAYKTQPGALWNLTSFDVEEEFTMSSSFVIKNFTKPRGGNINNDVNNSMNYGITNNTNSPLNMVSPMVSKMNENEILRSSLIKGRKGENMLVDEREKDNNLERKITLNYIMHCSKNFEYKNSQPVNLNNLFHYFNFQFEIFYESVISAGNYATGNSSQNFMSFHTGNYNNPNPNNNLLLNSQQRGGNTNNSASPYKIKSLTFTLKYVNRIKKINQDNNQNIGNNKNNNPTAENEIEIFTKTLTENLESILGTYNNNNSITNLQFSFKDNFCTIYNEANTLNFSFPLTINQFIPKDKRKMTIGLLLSSENLDVMIDILTWSFNFYSGEIYNENSNLILMDYNPPWPHNFLFNENILKMYNLIFNLIFPLKTNLTLLNQLWIDKKNFAKKENFIFRLIDSVHSEFVCFLQNLISFYMFDLIDLKFKQFYAKIKDCQDFEQIINSHEEFLGEVIANSFVKSKKIMRVIFDILFTTRKFYNYTENLLINLQSQKIEEGEDEDNVTKDQYEIIKVNLMGIKEEFNLKVKNLIFIFSKIKNTKYFTIISQLLTKLDYHIQTTD